MEIGIFSRTYETKTAEETFRCLAEDGIFHIQFNFLNCSLTPTPDEVPEEVLESIRRASAAYGISIDALTGTFNMIDPDEAAREAGILQFERQCRWAHALGIPVVTLCTGSKNPRSKWEWDDRNLEPSSWQDLRRTTDRLIRFAQDQNVVLGVETEASNIICTVQKARRFLDETGDPHLKIIMDGANLFHPGETGRMHEILDEAFSLLGKDIVIAHAKDLADSYDLQYAAAGEGCLDFPYYISLLRRYGYDGALIMHGLSQKQAVKSRTFLENLLQDSERKDYPVGT